MRLTIVAAALSGSALLAQRVPADPAAIEAGRQIYMGSCSGCHGATGEGSQGPSLLSGRASRLPDRALFNSIKNGLPGTSMPDFPLPDEKVWQIAAFVRSLTAPAASVPVPGDPVRGRSLFFGESGCSRCHMILGQGGFPGPDLSNIGAERTLHQLRESILKPSERISEGYRAAVATRKTGESVQGVAKSFNNYSIQIIDRAGEVHLLDRGDLSGVEIKAESLMPPLKNPEHATDLIAFLARQSARPSQGAAR